MPKRGQGTERDLQKKDLGGAMQSSEGSWKKQETEYKKRSLGWKGRG